MITISELNPSSIVNINADEASFIKGGIFSKELFDSVPDLEGIRGLLLTSEVREEIEFLSFGNIQDLFEYISYQ